MQWLIDLLLESLRGIIVAWSGAEIDIPSGWAICDGTQGTPNLRQRFILGSHPDFPPGFFGGDWFHEHDFTGDGHSHGLVDGPGGYADGSKDRDDRTGIESATGLTDSALNRPPYYALAFIMKL